MHGACASDVELNPEATVTSIDGISAYDSISRKAIVEGLARVPGGQGAAGSWCSGSRDGGRNPAANSDHRGTTKSSNSSNSAAALLAAPRQRDSVTPSR